jgi:LuxR family maltose regulon positive regulatory protein
MLQQTGKTAKKAQLKKAGDWFFKQNDYYRSIRYYRECGDHDGVAESLGFSYDMDSQHASIEETLAIIHLAVNETIIEKYPLLLQVLAWAVCVEGRIEETEVLFDKCYALISEIAPQNPRFALMTGSLKMMDHRLSNYDVLKEFAESTVPFDTSLPPTTPSFTYNLPFIHRCCCEFSEYAIDTENRLHFLREAWSGVFKDKFDIIENMIRAGVDYERGNLNEAHEITLSTIAAIDDDYALEFQFSVYMLFAAILEAQGQRTEVLKVLSGLEEIIDKHGAYYLSANFRAFCCRLELSNGNMNAAREWLKNNDNMPKNFVPFYMLYRYFTTARAFIVLGDYDNAIVLLKKTLAMIEKCKYRPLDNIETLILLAIANWKKTRSGTNIALEHLERAIIIAHEFEYIQIFANEGAELVNMLHRIQKRSEQKNYKNNELPASFVKTLYIEASMVSKNYKGLTDGRLSVNLSFTDKQKQVMHLMCQGFSRKEIAEKMGLKPNGIKSHTELIYKKLDVSNNIDAVMKIKEIGILEEM